HTRSDRDWSSDVCSSDLGTPRLVTTWQKAAPGTNGAITVAGTLAGFLATSAVALVFVSLENLGRGLFLVCAVAGMLGTVFDSLQIGRASCRERGDGSGGG